ncbi:MAG TPA: hypothetical protein VMG40_04210 [Bryobacteraceae bacterium]|nr:hypothetical protein [Bryobacteraceae bacterium]
MATLIASIAGTGAWLVGLSEHLWPAHPMIATFLLTVAVYVAAKLWLPPRIAL